MMGFIELGDICSIKTGKLDANFAVESGIYPFFTCSKDSLWINDYSYDCECVLVAGNGDLNVKYYHGKFDAYQRTYIIEVKNGKKYNTKYLYLLLENSIDYLRRKSIGGVIKYIKLHDLSSIKVPIIDLVEQEKIVERIFKYKSLFDLKKDQIKKIDQIIKSQFVEMFENCPKTKLFNIANITMGQSPSSDSYNNNDDGIPFFQGKADFGNKYTVINHWTNKPSKLANKNDVLMSVRAPVGPVNISSCDCCIGRGLCSINSKEGLTNNEFIYNALNTIQEEISKMGTGSTFKAITKNDVYNIELPMASIELQNKFALMVNQIDKQKFELEKSLKKLEELQKSLMQEYFG